jgi:hypothetical protein
MAVPAEITYAENTATYNTFCGTTEANSYFDRRLGDSSWTSASDDDKSSALYWATDILHRQSWIGAPKVYSQNFSWPRRYVPNRLSLSQGFRGDLEYIDVNTPMSLTFQYLDSDTIPQFLKDATSELAHYLMKRNSSGKTEVSQYTDQLSDLSLGGGAVEMKFREEAKYITDLPYQVYHIVSDFMKETKEIDPSISSVFSFKLNRS